jgi:dTDP-4-dehydrorhamnose reductase
MRILIFGGDGMLGHQLLMHLQYRHEVAVTLRQDLIRYTNFDLYNGDNSYTGIDIRSIELVKKIMVDFRPEAVINAVGVVKQRYDAKEIIPSVEINTLFPHRLAKLCNEIGSRLIHLSTDCVFSGKKGNYSENDLSDADDIYGKTKFLGEVQDSNSLTLRTSIIGRELSRHTSLLDWFLAQNDFVNGFTKAIYSGFTTLEMSRIIENILLKFDGVSGVYHVSSEPICKYDLLLLIKEILGHKIEIIPDDSFVCDRSLNSSRFREKFGYIPPSWRSMIEELKK